MNKVQTFRRQLMRRNFHLISSVGYEILSSGAGVQDAEHAVDRLPEKFVRLR
jgi:hypothetical protein